MRKLIITIAMVLVAVPCLASTRLMKLKEDRYMITHQKQTSLGGQGKALRLNYEKAGSLCDILGYSWFEIKSNESKGRTFGSGAASTMEVKFHKKNPGGDEAYDCKELATDQQRKKMRKALAKAK